MNRLLVCGWLGVAAACGAPASPGLEREAVLAHDAPAPIGPYSQALRVGDQVWCSGQIGLDPRNGTLVEGGVVAETRQALANLAAVLASAELSLDDVVATTVYLVDLDEFAAFNAEYARHFVAAPPARATVQVARLPKNARVEIQAHAVRRR